MEEVFFEFDAALSVYSLPMKSRQYTSATYAGLSHDITALVKTAMLTATFTTFKQWFVVTN